MKVLICLLAVVSLSAGEQEPDSLDSRSIASSVISAIEGIRDQMPCGFPDKGIPPLQPFVIPEKQVNIDKSDFKLNGTIQNFHLNGMNVFEIAEMKVNIVTSKVKFRFIFENINIDSWYELRLLLNKAGFTINMVGEGPAKFAIKNVEIWGSMTYSLGLISGKLKLKTLKARIRIEEAESDIQGLLGGNDVNKIMNKILEDVVKSAINENEDWISQFIEEKSLPVINDVLAKYKLGDIIGGSGNVEKVCIPPNAQ